ncbi:MAG: T9SS type A sorting domain-containing protein [Bacteroidota bacterium]|nr:T9SS type A sorting domain-containing protein [Bacteroidota bacterium]
MKNFLSILLVFVSVSLVAQNFSSPDNFQIRTKKLLNTYLEQMDVSGDINIEDFYKGFDNTLTNQEKGTKEKKWVYDTIYRYDSGGGADWDLKSVAKVIKRDYYGHPFKVIEESVGENAGEMVNMNYYNTFYYNANIIDVDMTFVWSSKTEEWLVSEYLKNNENGSLHEKYNKTWDVNTNIVTSGDRSNYTYDANGNMTVQNNQNYNVDYKNSNYKSDQWIDIDSIIYTYNEQNNCTNELRKVHDDNTGLMVNEYQYIKSYDSDGNCILQYKHLWDVEVNDWNEIYKYIYVFDDNGNEISWLSQNRDVENNVWVNSWQIIYYYDDNGNEISWLSQNWSATNDVWVNDWRHIANFDDNGNHIFDSYQRWNDEIGEWGNQVQMIMEYDQNSNLIYGLYQRWEVDSWLNSVQIILVYDDYGNCTSQIMLSWNNRANAWDNWTKEEVVWSEFDLQGISESESLNISIYPNPSNGIFNIEYKKPIDKGSILEVYNVAGKLISTQIITSNKAQVDISTCKKGMYFVKVNNGIVKVLKEK